MPGPSAKPPDELHPAISPSVHLSLTVVYITLYGFLFLMVYVQLWMILYYKHKRLSYQTVFLFLCLVWAGLRTTLFSFYFQNCTLANNLDILPYWLLYCCPVCLQFITLCLLVLFFAQVVFKSRQKYEPNKYKRPLRIGLGVASLIFLMVNVTCAVLAKRQAANGSSPTGILLVRVVINDSQFVVCGIALSVFIYKMSKLSSANMVLEAKGTTVCQAIAACVLVVLLYTSRAVYNMIAIAMPKTKMLNFGYGWINVSDQADYYDLSVGFAYVSFGVVLFVWEIFPTFIVVLFFRVQRPNNSAALPDMTSRNYNPRAYFFDNPRRYDSDDDLSRSFPSRGSFLDSLPPFTVNSNGTPTRFGSGSYTGRSPVFSSTPPPPPPVASSSMPGHANQPYFYDGT